MPTPELCTEDEVSQLVHTFYAKVRDDAILGPVFERHVADWDRHMPKMVDFWSSALRGSKNYRGTPMPVHCALPGLTHSMFEHWLDLFFDAAQALPNRAMAARAVELSQRIAQSLWYGYQLYREPERLPDQLPPRAPRVLASCRMTMGATTSIELKPAPALARRPACTPSSNSRSGRCTWPAPPGR